MLIDIDNIRVRSGEMERTSGPSRASKTAECPWIIVMTSANFESRTTIVALRACFSTFHVVGPDYSQSSYNYNRLSPSEIQL
jgi:hypothetical protein